MNPQSRRLPAGRSRTIGRGVFAIEEPQLVLPDPIAMDTSFVIEALLATQPLHRVCDAFLTRIVNSGVTVITSELLRLELDEAAYAIAMKERWAGKWRAHRTDGRPVPRAGRLMNETISRYQALLASLDHITVPLGDITTVATPFMTDYGLTSYDAVHAASAIAAGAETIVTTDTSFALLPASLLTLYTDRSRLTPARKKRPR